MRDVFINTLVGLAKNDPNIMLITGDLGFGVLGEFEKKYPSQYINAGVAEQNMTALAAGLALSGKIVFTYSIANFPTLRCLEQLRNDVCYHGANVTAVSIGGGFSYGGLGASHHATEDLAILRALPNIHALVPSDSWEVEEATKFLASGPGPGFLRLDKTLTQRSTPTSDNFEYGKARLIRDGSDATVFTVGGVLDDVLETADLLAKKNISLRILTMPSISAVDIEAVKKSVKETDHLFTVEEHRIVGGLGSAIAEELLETGVYPKLFKRFGITGSGFITDVGSQAYMKQVVGLDSNSLALSINAALES